MGLLKWRAHQSGLKRQNSSIIIINYIKYELYIVFTDQQTDPQGPALKR